MCAADEADVPRFQLKLNSGFIHDRWLTRPEVAITDWIGRRSKRSGDHWLDGPKVVITDWIGRMSRPG